MAAELVAGISQSFFIPFNTQRTEQSRTGIAGDSFQVETQGRAALVLCNIGYGQACGNYAKALIKGSELAQKRLDGRLT